MKSHLAFLLALLPRSPCLAQQGHDIVRIEGVYREVHANGDSSGAKYKTTDVMRILRHDGSTIYFDIGLNFYNGHTCSISGFAQRENRSFVFKGNFSSFKKGCELRINISSKKISFEDVENNCRVTCGARGGYAAAEFKLSKRRPFPAGQRFKQSSEYKNELEAFQKDRAGGK